MFPDSGYEYQKLELFIATSNFPLWDPHDGMFGSLEAYLTDNAGRLHEPGDASDIQFIVTVQIGSNNLTAHSFQAASVFTDINEMCDATLVSALQCNVRIASIGTRSSDPGDHKNCIQIGSSRTGSRRTKMSPSTIARNWGCTLDTAMHTLDVTTQFSIRTVANPSLSRQFRKNDWQLWYKRLGINIFTDTLDSSIRSKRSNKYGQMYCTHFWWTRA